MCVPEVLQSLVLAQFSVQLSHLQSHQPQQDVQSVRLFPRLRETHHVILERPREQSCEHTHTRARAQTSASVLSLLAERRHDVTAGSVPPTRHHRLSVAFFIRSDSDELLTQERGDVGVAVHKDSDWLLQ